VLSKQLKLLFITDTFEYSSKYINYLSLGLNNSPLFDLLPPYKLGYYLLCNLVHRK
jgi:hypothetical protein